MWYNVTIQIAMKVIFLQFHPISCRMHGFLIMVILITHSLIESCCHILVRKFGSVFFWVMIGVIIVFEIKIKMYAYVVRTLYDVKHIMRLTKNLISLKRRI